jgi:tripartite-type tricarboxylate transporter receptor subunit TctC
MVTVLRIAETQDRLIALGCEAVGNAPGEFAKFAGSERDKWAKVIKQAGIKLD